MSQHICPVVEVKLLPHPNADTLSIVSVKGFTVCVRTADWRDGMLGVYIPPESIVPDSPDFAFLGEHKRIRVKKLRGIHSQGLLIPAPEGSKVGDNLTEAMGIKKWQPVERYWAGGGEGQVSDNVEGPEHLAPKYDVENWRNFPEVFTPGETLIVTEKIHGANARYCYSSTSKEFWVGSRTNWKRNLPGIPWWTVVRQNPGIEEWCRQHPDLVLYGEIYGRVQDLQYGCQAGEIKLAVFDVWNPPEQRFLTRDEIAALGTDGIAMVPHIADVQYDPATIAQYADGPSLIPGAPHNREGCVLKPTKERFHESVGRVQLKIVSNWYLER